MLAGMADTKDFLAARFAFHRAVVTMLTRDFTPEDWTRKLPGGHNDAHWILGHLTTVRRQALGTLGRPVAPEPWMELFTRGARSGENERYPAPAEIVADFLARGEDLQAAFAGLSPEVAARPFERELPDGSKTVLDALGFFLFHEIYHLGQISALRLAAGKGGIA